MGKTGVLLGTLRSPPIVNNKGVHLKSDWLYRIEACAEYATLL